jgi:hypothetical protein
MSASTADLQPCYAITRRGLPSGPIPSRRVAVHAPSSIPKCTLD